jgi:hypothetical protein
MKVALDIDGTISEHPELFALLSAAAVSVKHLHAHVARGAAKTTR